MDFPHPDGWPAKIQLPVGIFPTEPPVETSWLHATHSDTWYAQNVLRGALLDPNEVARQVHRVADYLAELSLELPADP